ncbi:MAG: LLM class flavin-dependent oxidoreductase [Deltaproteobacteria bacterium]|nr:LLM class flavin-dependent oxidoreductase [Deltaproteobacteria bacterium]
MLGSMHPFESNLEALRMAEALDVDSLWLPDHLLGLDHPELRAESPYAQMVEDPDGWLDPFCVSTALAMQTELPLGINVTDGTRRRAPDVARTALTLQHMCRGGFNLGVGSGEAESLVPFGYPFDKPVGRLEEFLVELRCLLDTGRMPQGGPARTGIPLESGMGKPRIWVGGQGPRMLRLTGQYADGWLPAWSMEPRDYAAKRSVIARHAEAAGRRTPECGLFRTIFLGESRERLAEALERQPIAKLNALFIEGALWERHGIEHPAGAHSRGLVDVVVYDLDAEELRALAPRIPFELIEEFYTFGNADEVAQRFETYGPAGLEHLVLAVGMGILGGGEAEIERCTAEFARLRKMLGEI